MSMPRAATSVAHEEAKVLRLHAAHHALAIALRQVARQRLGVEALLLQELRDHRRLVAHVAEDDRALRLLGEEDLQEVAAARDAADDVVRVVDVARPTIESRDSEICSRLVHVAARVALHLVGHRRREQQRLVLLGQVRRDALDVLEEAHRQHLVALVEDERRDRACSRACGDRCGRARGPACRRRCGRRCWSVGDLLADRRAAVERLDRRCRGACRCCVSSRATCSASSRVGARISACGWRCVGISLLTSGRPNAVVLPVPVRDWTSRSLPSLTGLNTAVCTGVGAK